MNIINKIFQIWHSANIQTTEKPNAVKKGLYEKHASVGKNKTRSRRSDKQTELENTFLGILKKLLDVSHETNRQTETNRHSEEDKN